MRYFIADTHFWHRNLLYGMDNRPFKTVEDMNDYMMKQWNKRVTSRDEVVILGDFSFGSIENAKYILDNLNGNKKLIKGNHDRKLINSNLFDKFKYFDWVKDYIEFKENGKIFNCSHYPMLSYNAQYHKNSEGNDKTYMFHGHVHDTHEAKLILQCAKLFRETEVISRGNVKMNVPCHPVNCFCMFSDYTPLTSEEWIDLAQRREKELMT